MIFIMARHLRNLNYISLYGVVADLHPSFERARLTRGTLDLLGLHQVPMGIVSDVKGKHSSDQFESTPVRTLLTTMGRRRGFSREGFGLSTRIRRRSIITST